MVSLGLASALLDKAVATEERKAIQRPLCRARKALRGMEKMGFQSSAACLQCFSSEYRTVDRTFEGGERLYTLRVDAASSPRCFPPLYAAGRPDCVWEQTGGRQGANERLKGSAPTCPARANAGLMSPLAMKAHARQTPPAPVQSCAFSFSSAARITSTGASRPVHSL